MDIYRERIRDNISASKSGRNRAVKTQDELETSVDKLTPCYHLFSRGGHFTT